MLRVFDMFHQFKVLYILELIKFKLMKPNYSFLLFPFILHFSSKSPHQQNIDSILLSNGIPSIFTLIY